MELVNSSWNVWFSLVVVLMILTAIIKANEDKE